jgi:uncharacterized protein (TIGR02118 family)
MITRLGMAPRRSGLSTKEVLTHWRQAHADAASKIPGLRRYVQLHPVLLDGAHALGYPGFDACSELEFDSLEALDAGFGSRVYKSAVRDDEDRFVDRTRFSMVIAERHDLSPGPPPESPATRLLLLMRRHPATALEELWAAVTGPYADAVRAATPHHQVLRAVDRDRPGREVGAYDLVDELLFEDQELALSWFRSDAATAACLHLAGLVAGMTRYLAVEHVVLDVAGAVPASGNRGGAA